MVKLNKIYTRTGDDGTTALGTGSRVAKYDLRVEAYGTVDETNAAIGLARVHSGASAPALDAMLGRIQNDLFDLGADLCFPDESKKGQASLRVSDAQIARLEAEIDEMNGALDPLRSFVLPGGTPTSAYLHLARTVCRRAERLIVALASRPDEPVSAQAVSYINRLSDFLFVAARYANGKGASDVLWVPGQNG
ncbi:cob(I)yrinic acid a,c-diamide adenosyltransferase [Methyloceanibacter sp.]|uniref:cob(I)yrinic acid a,c-diamide adenosyltransferase n=1 Tax=Methyloceanibacter sp. TaxID=1965321 RepID=UPI0020805382|nr:cob(I)yrinic acid a,c-diamide adenosyltransferase [Methyloceanibacter sp.]GFO83545.1 MAG: cob(I)yrinic acid a,c-diamide adenosyltransferase [Methyloceanibacter sp.]HML93749.1 cob(I)yrinic acid a,c-diamide adenosyltransferase [Methyloceanibacter sp.]